MQWVRRGRSHECIAKCQAEWCAAIKLGWLREGWMKLFGILIVYAVNR